MIDVIEIMKVLIDTCLPNSRLCNGWSGGWMELINTNLIMKVLYKYELN